MSKMVMRFDDMKARGVPLMFIDSILPAHWRMNYAVIGDTASENPDFRLQRMITAPHRFQLGMAWAPPGCGPAWHTHDYTESFFILRGPWRFYWGNSDDPAKAEGHFDLDAWDLISLPPGMYRSFEYRGGEVGWFFAVLEAHEVYQGKDPYWSPQIEQQAAAHGFHADDKGKMVQPPDYEQLRQQQQERLLTLYQELTGCSLADWRPDGQGKNGA
ncbi:MAG: hypothetical protein OXH77_05565 [Anaerolineaceae bacterium]|nr:hypothetical protein [Anaerolineaceae bacterium]